MSLRSFWRKVVGSPIMFDVKEYDPKKKYIWFVDSDNPDIIKAFKKQVDVALKDGYVIVPTSVNFCELNKNLPNAWDIVRDSQGWKQGKREVKK